MSKLPKQPKSFKSMREGNHPKSRIGSKQELQSAMRVRGLGLAATPINWGPPGVSKGEVVETNRDRMGNHTGPDEADKGHKGGSCNRSACQRPGAHWYNHSTQLYYCRRCAIDLNIANRSCNYVKELGHDLCTLDPEFADVARR